MRAHLLGGVPTAEVQAKRPLFDALGFDLTHAFARRKHDDAYLDFAPALTDRADIRPRIEKDAGVQARVQTLCAAFTAWWGTHAARLADLPARRDLNAVRHEFLESFVAALEPLGVLDRFKLAGVIAAWWTDTLPDFKTLLENGFSGVIDGWVDTIADAVEDDDNAGPAFDPFGHELVRRTMADYLERIAAARADIARLKGEKESCEQSNAPDDTDEGERASWNYAKDLERQMRELKEEHRNPLKDLARLEKAANKARATDADRKSAVEARIRLQPTLDRMAALEKELAPYEETKRQLTESRARYGALIAAFVDELKSRCGTLNRDQKRALVLELFAQDVQTGLDAAVTEKRQETLRVVEGLWDKYAFPMSEISQQRERVMAHLADKLRALRYAR